MNFDEWEPVYEAILADFGFDRGADEDARDLIATLTEPFDPARLPDVAGETVAVAGGAPSLPAELDAAREADVVFAASSSAAILREAGVDVALMTTDLDKIPATARDLTREGVPVAVHAHGDNVPAVREWVPRFADGWTLPTTQAEPVPGVENAGGFTDGDRAAFLADHLGAARLTFPGWDFDDLDVGPVKRRKLAWAERLLRWLERRRGEAFPVLDGRRGALGPLP
jgi:hypothetical protein